MRKLFTLCLLVFSLYASAQWQQTGSKVRYVNGLGIPTRDTAAGVAADSSQILIRPADSALYVKYKRTWLRVGGGGGSIAGSGTANYIPKFTSSSAIGNSQIFDNGTSVGIGTASPVGRLHLLGAGTEMRVESNTTTDGFIRYINTSGSMSFGMSGAPTNTMLLYDRTNNHNAYEYLGGASGRHVWYTANAERMRITSGGDVGIGTTSPSEKLHLVGNTFRQNDASNSFGYTISTTSATTTLATLFGGSSFGIRTGGSGSDNMRITSGGNVLIGTTTDNGTDRLQVSGSVRTSSNLQVDGLVGINITPASYSLNINSGGTNVTRIATQQTNNINDYEHSSSTPFGRIGNASGFNASGATGDMSVGSYNNLSFYTRSGSFIERARITATSGNVLISKTTDNGIDKLQVNGSIDAKGFAQAYTTKTGAYTATTSDYLIDCLSGTFTVTLPDALLNVGRILVIKNSGTGTITVDGNGSQTIDGATTYSLSAQWATVQIMCDGGNWKIISKF